MHKITRKQALEKLEALRKQIDQLKQTENLLKDDGSLDSIVIGKSLAREDKWRRDVETTIDYLFDGKISREHYLQKLKNLNFSVLYNLEAPVGFDQAQRLFDSMAEEILQFWPDENSTEPPTEIRKSLELFKEDHPDPLKTAFIMMKFGDSSVHLKITEAVKHSLNKFEILGIRADEKQYHDDLFYNILTYIYGCGIGIAVFERIEADEFNPNVSFEVGYMIASNKPVCLLKDRTLKTLQTDLIGKLYRVFDPLDPSNTIPDAITRWLIDKGFVAKLDKPDDDAQQSFDDFRKIANHRDLEKKRDVLRDILGDVVPDMLTILNIAVDKSQVESLMERTRALHKRTEAVRPLFNGNEKVERALTGIGNIVGSSMSPYFPVTTEVFDAFYKDVQILKDELASIEKILSN